MNYTNYSIPKFYIGFLNHFDLREPRKLVYRDLSNFRGLHRRPQSFGSQRAHRASGARPRAPLAPCRYLAPPRITQRCRRARCRASEAKHSSRMQQNARKRRASVLETSDEEESDACAHPELVNSEDTDSSIEQERAVRKAKRRKLGRAFKSRAREKTTLKAMRGCCQNTTRLPNLVFVDTAREGVRGC